ncbi:hypothetical protein SH528x_003451 [Novipirellula sp. SH528]|uniref:hypothetical protein n=1 Tax=Novipirellula sp. SH528 TaxID=3454466 RepID=UPI003F9F18BD
MTRIMAASRRIGMKLERELKCVFRRERDWRTTGITEDERIGDHCQTATPSPSYASHGSPHLQRIAIYHDDRR